LEKGEVTQTPGITLSIVIPAYNEALRIDSGMERLCQAAEGGAFDPRSTEIIVVDDGSTDDTGERAEKALRTLPHVTVLRLATNSGKGAAVRAGVASATGLSVAFTDADTAIDPSQFAELSAALRESDIAIGSRTLTESAAERELMRRSLMGRAFNRLVSLATDLSLHDTQCGFKGFRTPVGRLLFHFMVFDRFAFDVDVLSTAHRLQFSIAEVPVHWRHIGGSRIRPLSDPILMAHDVLRARKRLRYAPPVTAIAVSHQRGRPAALEAAQRAAGPLVPLIDWRDDSVLVLLALCDPPQVAAVVDRLGSTPETTSRELAVTVDQLSNLAPLKLRTPNLSGPAPGSTAPQPLKGGRNQA